MSNVFSLADRRARIAAKPLPVAYEPEEDIAFPSDDAPPAPEPERIYSPDELAPEPQELANAVRDWLRAPIEPEPEPVAPVAEPTGPLQWHATHVELELPVAKALLEFASKDATRPHLGIGIEGVRLCATDGHTLVVFESTTSGAPLAAHTRRVWSRAHVETAVKVARAMKAPALQLRYADTLDNLEFPPVLQVIPEYGVKADGPISVNPEYLARMTAVAKAVGVQGVQLTAAKGQHDPLAFEAGTARHDLRATVVIMPMRVD